MRHPEHTPLPEDIDIDPEQEGLSAEISKSIERADKKINRPIENGERKAQVSKELAALQFEVDGDVDKIQDTAMTEALKRAHAQLEYCESEKESELCAFAHKIITRDLPAEAAERIDQMFQEGKTLAEIEIDLSSALKQCDGEALNLSADELAALAEDAQLYKDLRGDDSTILQFAEEIITYAPKQ
jgi:hypothetical protein